MKSLRIGAGGAAADAVPPSSQTGTGVVNALTMAKSKKRQGDDSSAEARASADTGRQSIHGDNADYGDRVAQRAYELYLARGGTDGKDFDDWLTAERELNNGHDHRGDSGE
jgi:DUF2934 family protein